MNLHSLQRQLHHSHQRRLDLLNAVLSFSRWLPNSELNNPEASKLLARAVERLRNFSFQVACVGEFSRGKTELINALLFDQFNCRLLPSRPGRTTMCPTEIGFDPNLPVNSIQLLPMVTRRSGTSIRSFKQIPEHWVSQQFDLGSSASLQDALGRIAERQYVSEQQARDLGFNCARLLRHPQNIHEVEIPAWRYAVINLNHPLLAQGLRIIDTPGLNAPGTDPEVTLSPLGEADSTVFCLAADAPVSATDRAFWLDHISSDDNSASLVVINKIDSLWDDLVSAPAEETVISSVRTDTALALGLPLQQVVPMSAKRGLLAKARSDRGLLQKSNFQQFEAQLIARLQDQLHALFKLPEVEDAQALVRQTQQLLRDRLSAQASMVARLQAATSAPEATLAALRQEIKDAHRQAHQITIAQRGQERRLDESYRTLKAVFDEKHIGRLLSYLHSAASDPDPVLRPAIKATLNQIQLGLSKLAIVAEQTNQVLDAVLAESDADGRRLRFSGSHLNIDCRLRQYAEFKQRCEQFLAGVEQATIANRPQVRHFLLRLSQEVMTFVEDTNCLLQRWHQQALLPVAYSNECRKQLLQKELLLLSRVAADGTELTPDQALVALRLQHSQSRQHIHDLEQLLEPVDRLQPVSTPCDKVVSLDFARRRTV